MRCRTPTPPTRTSAPLPRFGRRWDETAAAVAIEPKPPTPVEQMNVAQLRELLEAIEHELRTRIAQQPRPNEVLVFKAAVLVVDASVSLHLRQWQKCLTHLDKAADMLRELRS